MRKMSIGENYVGKLTPMRSNISRFSRGTHFCRRFAPYRFGPFCFPGVENYSTGWIVEDSSFLISLQMKSSISKSER